MWVAGLRFSQSTQVNNGALWVWGLSVARARRRSLCWQAYVCLPIPLVGIVVRGPALLRRRQGKIDCAALDPHQSLACMLRGRCL
jgi:hypothetical protein